MKKPLSVASPEEFKNDLLTIDIHVPARAAGRKKDQVERYSVAHLLASLPPGELSYPPILIHRDRPDFLFQMANTEIGVEHIEAVSENLVRVSIFRQRRDRAQVYLLQRHQPNELIRSNDSILRDITRNKVGAPWVGDEVEVDWANVMLCCIKAKVETLNKPGFTRFKENWLLVYGNWSLPGLNHQESLFLLYNAFLDQPVLGQFDRMFILGSKVMCEIGKDTGFYPVRAPHLGANPA